MMNSLGQADYFNQFARQNSPLAAMQQCNGLAHSLPQAQQYFPEPIPQTAQPPEPNKVLLLLGDDE